MGETLTQGERDFARASSEYEVTQLRGILLYHYWPTICVELDRIPQYWNTWWTKEYIYEAACREEMQVWAVGPKEQFQFVLITRIGFYPANRILQSVVGFGNHIELCAPVLWGAMQRFASTQGCTVVEVVGRQGWELMLKDKGFRRTGVIFEASVPSMKVN